VCAGRRGARAAARCGRRRWAACCTCAVATAQWRSRTCAGCRLPPPAPCCTAAASTAGAVTLEELMMAQHRTPPQGHLRTVASRCTLKLEAHCTCKTKAQMHQRTGSLPACPQLLGACTSAPVVPRCLSPAAVPRKTFLGSTQCRHLHEPLLLRAGRRRCGSSCCASRCACCTHRRPARSAPTWPPTPMTSSQVSCRSFVMRTIISTIRSWMSRL